MDAGKVPHTSAWSPWTSSALALVWSWRSPRRRRPPTKSDAAAAQPAFLHASAPAADVKNRVKIMLKLLGEEADSFGKRAEMYYRRRPEVINHVEDVYRANRALVERYDHLSKELHKANHTIATACPEEVQYAMLEEEDDNFPRAIMPIYNLAIYLLNINHLVTGKERLKNIHMSPRNELLLYPVD